MIRVMIVEDEPPIARAIASCIAKDSRFTVISTVMTGQKALEKLHETPIDIVFTDVRMPVMDGLTLAKRLREQFPQVLAVIISGYQEFEYLQTAIREQVVDYLLKPVTQITLAPVLDRLAQRVKKGRSEDLYRMIEALIFHESQAIIPDGEFALGIFCAGPFPLVDDSLLPGRAFWHTANAEQEWLRICGEHGMCFPGRTGAEMVFVIPICGEVAFREYFQTLWKSFQKDTSLPVTATFSAYQVSGAALGELYKNLRHMLYTETRLFVSAFLEAPIEVDELHLDGMRKEFGRALRQHDISSLENCLSELIESFYVSQATELQLLHFLEAVLEAHLDPLSAKAASCKLELRATVSNAQSPVALADDIAYLLASLFEEDEGTSQEPPLIRQVEEYLWENYQGAITTSVLSEQFGFVPSYLSKLFRLYRGVSPSEYLTQYRIERACELIDANSEILMKEVALATGFSDQYYFSKIFKKDMGVLPTEYAGKMRS